MLGKRALSQWILPPPVGIVVGWATGASAGAPAPAVWTVAGLVAWCSVPYNLSFVVIGAVAGLGTFVGIRRWITSRADESELEASAKRDALTHRLLTRDLVERVKAAMDAGTLTDDDRTRLVDAVIQSVERDTDATPQIAGSFAEAVGTLAQSADPADRAIASVAVTGNPIEAADQLMAEVDADRLRGSERARQAGRLYAPYSLSKAVAAYAQAVDLNPLDFWTWIELSRLHQIIGSLPEARRCAEQALQHASGDRQRSVAETELGDTAKLDGDVKEAKRRYEAAIAIDERLASLEPHNLVVQADLSVSQKNLGALEANAGNLAAARERYQASRTIRDKLITAEPDFLPWQHFMATSELDLGDVDRKEGSLRPARERYEASLAIARKLTLADPNNYEWQRDLFLSYDRLARTAEADGDPSEAIRQFEQAEHVISGAARKWPENAKVASDLDNVRENLGRLRGM